MVNNVEKTFNRKDAKNPQSDTETELACRSLGSAGTRHEVRGLQKHFLQSIQVSTDSNAIHHCVMNLDGERHHSSSIEFANFSERHFRYRIFATPVPRVRKARERNPRQHAKMNSVILRPRVKCRGGTLFVNRLHRVRHELPKVFLVIEVHHDEGFVRQQESRSTMNDLVNEDLIAPQPVTKRLNLVHNAQREVVIGEREAEARSLLQLIDKTRHVERRAKVEVGFIVSAEELKSIPPRPV